MPITLADIASFLDEAFLVGRFPDDPHGVVVPSARPIQRIGLAREPWPGMRAWSIAEGIDALWLHRPFRLSTEDVPANVGVLAHHLAFDAALTFAESPRLAVALGMRGYTPFSPLDGIPRGMVGDIAPTAPDDLVTRLTDIFGFSPTSLSGPRQTTLARIVVASALSPILVHEAAAEGVHGYLTGQYRPSAKLALQTTGLVLITIGHASGEQWGLRALAGMLRERWAMFTVVLAPEPLPPASSAPAV